MKRKIVKKKLSKEQKSLLIALRRTVYIPKKIFTRKLLN